jgi:CelD/BcsL family acetyltransferase involved in cellulose biosynthesis
MLRSYWLKFQGVYIAYLMGFEQSNVFYAWNMAFLPVYEHYFPSKLLMRLSLEDCFERGNAEYHFMRGETPYKAKWTKTTRKNFRFRIRNNKQLYGRIIHKIEDMVL